jgi:hypothetical protein
VTAAQASEQVGRHRCRQCRGKLSTPTEIPQRAFCTRFCFDSFYRHRCRVCEEPIRRRAEHQKVCIRRNCKNELRRYPHLYQLRFGTQGSRNVATPLKSADKTGTKNALASNRARIVAPAHVLDVELARDWPTTVSSDGVAIEVGRLRHVALRNAKAVIEQEVKDVDEGGKQTHFEFMSRSIAAPIPVLGDDPGPSPGHSPRDRSPDRMLKDAVTLDDEIPF